jgi:hypothetical protein
MPDQFDIQRKLDHAGEAEVEELMDKLADDKDDDERRHRERLAQLAKNKPVDAQPLDARALKGPAQDGPAQEGP